jgi:hypothetical protein
LTKPKRFIKVNNGGREMLKKIRTRFRNQVIARLAPAIGRTFLGKIFPRVNQWQDWDSSKCYYFGAGCNNWVHHDSAQFEESKFYNGYVVCNNQDCEIAASEELTNWEEGFWY